MRRHGNPAWATSVLIAALVVMAATGCAKQDLDARLGRVTEITVFAAVAAERLDVSAETADGERLMELLSDAEPADAPPGETTPSYSVVFKDGDAIIATVSFSEGDRTLRLQTDDGVSGVVSPAFTGEVERQLQGR